MVLLLSKSVLFLYSDTFPVIKTTDINRQNTLWNWMYISFVPFVYLDVFLHICRYVHTPSDCCVDWDISASYLNLQQHFQTPPLLENSVTPPLYLIMAGLDSALILSILFYLIYSEKKWKVEWKRSGKYFCNLREC